MLAEGTVVDLERRYSRYKSKEFLAQDKKNWKKRYE